MTFTHQQRAILQAVRELEPEAYGLAVIDRTAELLGKDPHCCSIWKMLLGGGISYGGVYLDLERLEDLSLVESWSDGIAHPERGGRPRRYFRLTNRGVWESAPEPEREEVPVALRVKLA
jgi:DNA-binding PadR family transcriptional regulator